MALDRRRFLALLGAAAGSAALGGCAGFSGGRDDGGGAASDDEITFTLWAGDAELVAFRAIARDFEAAEGIRVKLQQVPFDQLLTTVDAGLQAGQAPDVFRVTYTDLGVYSSQDALLDLSDHLPGGYADQFRPGLWSAVTRDGAPFGVPHHTDTSMILVRADAAQQAGLTLPTSYDEAWSWEQLDEALVRLAGVTAAQQYATGVNWQQFGAYRWLNFLGQAGGRLLTDDLSAPAVDSPEGREALRFTQSFFERGLVPPTTSTKGDYVDELFIAGTTASVFAGDFLLPAIADAGFDFGATFLPRNRDVTAELGGNAVVATADSPRAEQAALFLQYLASQEQMARFCEATTVLPTRTDLAGGDLEYQVRPDLMELFVAQSEAITEDIVEQTTVPSFNEINAALVEQLERAFVGRVDAEAVLADLSADIERALAP
ncbi:ABC transporter substrate-binding protein [Cellulomonas aerilata]|uniref:ABC transporter substrate-binding protein n=1 Tax=Cellulomonas aerilata TaxID=515326 RepID=A0A512DCY8_9CELL|nr:sugar ABC transporter substrate-binding protein [Cellulomonas aerilata]GEO34080.1 ABC transporter substrate-binding protein [Cellulomonas aerilata]